MTKNLALVKSKFCEYKLCSVNESIIINTENENISSSLYGKYNVDNIMAAVCMEIFQNKY